MEREICGLEQVPKIGPFAESKLVVRYHAEVVVLRAREGTVVGVASFEEGGTRAVLFIVGFVVGESQVAVVIQVLLFGVISVARTHVISG